VPGGDLDGGRAHAAGELAFGVRRDRLVVLGDEIPGRQGLPSREAVAGFFADFGATMEVEEFTPISVAANDTDVLTVVRFRARSRAAGKTAAMDLHHYFTLRDGKIAYYRGTEDTAQTQAVLQA
jgi:ketosteroid isomerase-like protein